MVKGTYVLGNMNVDLHTYAHVCMCVHLLDIRLFFSFTSSLERAVYLQTLANYISQIRQGEDHLSDSKRTVFDLLITAL